MKLPTHSTTLHHPQRCGLYRFVFLSTWSVFLVTVLVCSFLLQTVERAFAMEVSDAPGNLTPIVTDSLLDRIESVAIPIAAPQPIAVQGEQAINEVPSTVGDFAPIIDEVPPGEQSESLVAITDEPVIVQDIPLSEVSPETEALTTTQGATASGSEMLINELLAVATSSATSTDENPVPTLTVESDTMLQFTKDNCVAVADGSFYCQAASSTADTESDGLFALPDQDGDLEIYLKRNGELSQLTFNTVDDASPHYDPASESIVWHRVIDDRYQIMMYDIGDKQEQQLTDTTTNNMEPFRSDNIIVWQHWANSAWQIMMYDGDTITALTDTLEHNLAPTVRNGLVVWHRVTNGVKTIEVYDMTTASYVTIEDTEGGTIGNPRMVLVYDATMENGDTVTRGYDLVTGEITSFAATPSSLPEELPEPDTLNEERALIAGKQIRGDGAEDEATDVIDSDISDEIATTTPALLPLSATSTGLTLDLTATTSSAVIDALPPVIESIPDLTIPAFVPDDATTDL